MEQITREEMMGLLSRVDKAMSQPYHDENTIQDVRRVIAALQAAEPVGANTFACHCAGGVVITTDPATGQCVAVTRQDDEGRVLSTVWESPQPAKAQVPDEQVAFEAWTRTDPLLSEHELDRNPDDSDDYDNLFTQAAWNAWQARALLTASPVPNNDKDGCTCQGCGIVYAADLIVPDEWWEKIKPEGKAEGSGLLCPTCIMDRLVEKGWSAGHIASPAPEHSGDGNEMVGWISVDERLPEPGITVMVYAPPQPGDYADDVRIGFDSICPESDGDYWLDHGEHYEHYSMVAKGGEGWAPSVQAPYTHWMPLPEPPQGGEDE